MRLLVLCCGSVAWLKFPRQYNYNDLRITLQAFDPHSSTLCLPSPNPESLMSRSCLYSICLTHLEEGASPSYYIKYATTLHYLISPGITHTYHANPTINHSRVTTLAPTSDSDHNTTSHGNRPPKHSPPKLPCQYIGPETG